MLPSGGAHDRCYRRALRPAQQPDHLSLLGTRSRSPVSDFFAATIFRRPLAANRGFVLALIFFGISELLFGCGRRGAATTATPRRPFGAGGEGKRSKKNDQALAMRLIMLAGFRNILPRTLEPSDQTLPRSLSMASAQASAALAMLAASCRQFQRRWHAMAQSSCAPPHMLARRGKSRES
jgi:hypothetical protein